MKIEKQISDAIKDIPPGESIRVLGTLISEVLNATEEANKEIRQTFNVPVNEIDLFPDHPYYVETDDDMNDLVKSIKKYGMITPGAVRTKDDGRYELLSGHRRLWACKLAGIEVFRCEILNLSDEEALLFMIEANRQRPKLYPCEKGQVYRLRQKNTQPCSDLREIRIEAEDNPGKINAYMQLGNLIPEFQEFVDEGKMSLRPAAELACLSEEMQNCVLETIEYEQCLPSHDQAKRMKKMFQEGALTEDIIADIMMEEKPNQRDRLVIRDNELLARFPKNFTAREREEYITKALDFYEKHGRR